ncbi:probable small nuclear ribonucleoprotein G (nucleomorph) [Guillardia theta]|uniref:Probable small nuclear ribonucleoprotein G n=1 Tax=Guillardia theta TaxID=55529 RepID=Q98SD8_GUITH|nr:probable small nuclear ribonucleoprotein G [Guillardia theta]AAK39646.1 probable small nuclear ribonucleoprotein G [Guillardia theta]
MTKILLRNNRIVEGDLLQKESNMNVLMRNSIEYRKKMTKRTWEKREIGTCIIKGSCIVLITEK